MSVVLGIDLGTSYFKSVVVTPDGRIAGLSRRAVMLENPAPGHLEVSVETVCHLIALTIQDALDAAGREASEVVSISYSSQANTFALFDDEMDPLTPFIIWSDTRVSSRPKAVKLLVEEAAIPESTGLGLFGDQMFPVKLVWLREGVPELRRRGEVVMTISDYLSYALTGKRFGDSSTGSLTGLWDVKGNRYWTEALEILELPSSMFSELYRPGTPLGYADGPLARTLGLNTDVQVVAGAIDHYAAAIGSGVGSLGDASESTGTVLALVTRTDSFFPSSGSSLGPDLVPGRYYSLRFTNNGAGSVEWYQRSHAPEYSLDRLTALAAKVPPGSYGLRTRPETWTYENRDGFVFTEAGINATGGPQHRDDSITGEFRKEHYDHGCFFRAILESVAFSLSELVDSRSGEPQISTLIGTGGGAQNDLWLQIKADMLGLPVLRTAAREPAAYGAALLAAGAIEWASDIEELTKKWQRVEAVFEPDPDRHEAYKGMSHAP